MKSQQNIIKLVTRPANQPVDGRQGLTSAAGGGVRVNQRSSKPLTTTKTNQRHRPAIGNDKGGRQLMSVEPSTATIKSQIFALNVTPPRSYPHNADLAVADDYVTPDPKSKGVATKAAADKYYTPMTGSTRHHHHPPPLTVKVGPPQPTSSSGLSKLGPIITVVNCPEKVPSGLKQVSKLVTVH